MPLLIDGYNLLHASGVASAARGRTALERSRLGLLNFLSEAIPWETVETATIVFDAAGAPSGLPDRITYRGLDVQFARHYRDADELLEALIAQHTSPRRLTVVSSDHRVQRAAKRRRARAIDADVWYEQTRQEYQSRAADRKKQTTDPGEDRPSVMVDNDAQVREWLAAFTEEKPTEVPGVFSDEYLQRVAAELDAAQTPIKPKRPTRKGT